MPTKRFLKPLKQLLGEILNFDSIAQQLPIDTEVREYGTHALHKGNQRHNGHQQATNRRYGGHHCHILLLEEGHDDLTQQRGDPHTDNQAETDQEAINHLHNGKEPHIREDEHPGRLRTINKVFARQRRHNDRVVIHRFEEAFQHTQTVLDEAGTDFLTGVVVTVRLVGHHSGELDDGDHEAGERDGTDLPGQQPFQGEGGRGITPVVPMGGLHRHQKGG